MSRSSDAPQGTVSSDESIVGATLGDRYRIEQLIGRGGMGAVYRALDLKLRRAVAVKILRETDAADEERFGREVQLLAQLAHPNLVRLLDAGDLDLRPYLVMDLIDGPNLAHRLAAGALSHAEVATIGAGIAGALAYVHDAGIVHRDIKPANILLDHDGNAHLADFGIARLVDTTGLTMTGITLGTPAYLAPEQIQGTEIGPGVDVYALGLVLIECLSGRRAFEGTPSEIAAARLQRDPTLPADLDDAWRQILSSMMARSPGQRIAASEVVSAIDGFARADKRSPSVALPLGDTTAVLGVGDGRETLPLDQTMLEPASALSIERTERDLRPHRRPFSRRGALALVVACAVAALAAGLLLGGVFASAPVAKGGNRSRVSATSTTVVTSTTTSTTTTTTVPAPTVASAEGALVTALDSGVTSGDVAPPIARQLINQLQPLVTPAGAQDGQQQIQQFDQFVAQFDQAVQNGQISGAATISSLNAAIGSLATALGTTVPTASAVTTTLPIGPGQGNGNGNGNGHGNGVGHDH